MREYDSACCRVRVKIPLHCAPHAPHVKIDFSSPDDPSRRSPQSLQKTRDPMADMMCSKAGPCVLVLG